mmetsp:Transcript_127928/g.368545  ORF Transcript_127928/g.368545 Transcript_127928/m.368545 type:complete len:547 (+) Transcript_127928:102-1742(+)|eukprot:CAMPEP_0170230192 /NCGR_PEP_ID=MMETSP0116_2-20130129/14827_1 /TAXON_ID=400756 /ORGANISM="Durinskia baltica, Strain CSIRO CS-38" /LENGTH=546 /DNA_ID=CAMNT_0010480957 /DNA_START=102 /DNA_END=1742 /DNA_ORIENTATION=-
MAGADMAVALAKADLVVRHESCSFVDKRYVVIRRIGSGSFGTVDLLRDRRTGAERVCKIVKVRGMKEHVVSQMKKEIMLLQELDHPRIVRMYEYAEDAQTGTLQLILEYLPGGPCSMLLHGGRRPAEDVVARLVQQVLSAAAYCHARGIVHCDLKPENVLLTAPVRFGETQDLCCAGRREEPVDCKVIDFGLAAHFVPSGPDAIGQFAGTPAFIAPEVIEAMHGGRFGPKADIWSIGVIAYNLLSSRLPFGSYRQEAGAGQWQIFSRIRSFRRIDFRAPEWSGCSEEARDFVGDLMQHDPKRRPTAVEALQHDWLQDRGALQHKRLRRSMLRGMRDFARAPPLVKICLMLIASRAAGKTFKRCAREFMRLDLAGAGSIKLEDLQEAIDHPGGMCPMCCYPRVDAQELFREVNLSGTSGIDYTEFAAACLFAELGSKSGRELAAIAFNAFDDDGDGLVTAQTVFSFFSSKHREGLPLLRELPRDRPFNEDEFYRCLRRGQGARRRMFCPLVCCSGGAAVANQIFDDLSSGDEMATSSITSHSSSEGE